MLNINKSIFLNLLIYWFSISLAFAQSYSADSNSKPNNSWFVATDYEKTLSQSLEYSSIGFAASFLIKDRGFIGFYASGIISEINFVDLNNDISLYNDKKVNFAHGGIYLGIRTLSYKKNYTLFTVKVGRGSIYLYNNENYYNYSLGRDNLWVITPAIETNLKMLNWIYLKFNVGVKFIGGLSAYSFKNGNKIPLYNNSNFEGLIIGFSFKFCKN